MAAPETPQGEEMPLRPAEDGPRPGDTNAPTAFAFGEAPEPQTWPEPTQKPKHTGAATHTGTDPHGRAIGPREDHRKAKRDIDGLTAADGPDPEEKA